MDTEQYRRGLRNAGFQTGATRPHLAAYPDVHPSQADAPDVVQGAVISGYKQAHLASGAPESFSYHNPKGTPHGPAHMTADEQHAEIYAGMRQGVLSTRQFRSQ